MKLKNGLKFIGVCLFIVSFILLTIHLFSYKVTDESEKYNVVKCYDEYHNEMIGQTCKERVYQESSYLHLISLLLTMVSVFFVVAGTMIEIFCYEEGTNFWGFAE